MSLNVSSVKIENGILIIDFFEKTQSIKSFLSDKAPVIEQFGVKGYKFNRVLLTNGTQENGSGWAFFK